MYFERYYIRDHSNVNLIVELFLNGCLESLTILFLGFCKTHTQSPLSEIKYETQTLSLSR